MQKHTHIYLNVTQNLNQQATCSSVKTVQMSVLMIWHNYSVRCNTAQNSSDNLPSYPPDNHHSSDVGGRVRVLNAMHSWLENAYLHPVWVIWGGFAPVRR